MSAKTTSSKAFRVALNPRNPEANSWYDNRTGINLSLGYRREYDPKKDELVPMKDTGPISPDLSELPAELLEPICRGILFGLLIVAEGDLPEGVELEKIQYFAAGRSRWAQGQKEDPKADDFKKAQADALAHWDELLRSENGKQKVVVSSK